MPLFLINAMSTEAKETASLIEPPIDPMRRSYAKANGAATIISSRREFGFRTDMDTVTRTMAVINRTDTQEFHVKIPKAITTAEKNPAISAVPAVVLFFSVNSSKPFRNRLRPFSTPAVSASVLPDTYSKMKWTVKKTDVPHLPDSVIAAGFTSSRAGVQKSSGFPPARQNRISFSQKPQLRERNRTSGIIVVLLNKREEKRT